VGRIRRLRRGGGLGQEGKVNPHKKNGYEQKRWGSLRGGQQAVRLFCGGRSEGGKTFVFGGDGDKLIFVNINGKGGDGGLSDKGEKKG